MELTPSRAAALLLAYLAPSYL